MMCSMINGLKTQKRMGRGLCLGSAGSSLIELLIAMAISSIAISASMNVFSSLGHRFAVQHSTMVTNQDLRLGLDVLCSEVRLAGGGLLGGDSPFLTAKPDEIEFFANLSGASTTLTEVAEVGRQDLPVDQGAGWPKGKQILLCTVVHCTWNQLAADGRKQALALVTPTTEQFPVRSAIFLLNRVRYYVRRQDDGAMRVMRDVDGGASTLIGDVRQFELQYVDRDERVTTDLSEVVRVRVTVRAGRQESSLVRDVAIRM